MCSSTEFGTWYFSWIFGEKELLFAAVSFVHVLISTRGYFVTKFKQGEWTWDYREISLSLTFGISFRKFQIALRSHIRAEWSDELDDNGHFAGWHTNHCIQILSGYKTLVELTKVMVNRNSFISSCLRIHTKLKSNHYRKEEQAFTIDPNKKNSNFVYNLYSFPTPGLIFVLKRPNNKWLAGVHLRGCCDDSCFWSSDTNLPVNFAEWRSAEMICPEGTKLVRLWKVSFSLFDMKFF